MKGHLILDLDGVMITTPSWKSDPQNDDGYSDFNKVAVQNLNELCKLHKLEIWLSSSRRLNKSLSEFNQIFINRGIIQNIAGYLPASSEKLTRSEEIERFIKSSDIGHYIIIDDDKTLGGLEREIKQWWIQTEPLIGFNNSKLLEAKQLLKNWL